MRATLLAIPWMVLLAAAGQTAAQSFHLVGVSAGSGHSEVRALSENGQVAAGFSSTPRYTAFTWTQSGGRNDFGLEMGTTQTLAYGVSSAGSVVVGESFSATTSSRAFRWRGPGTLETLGTLPGADGSVGLSVSGDGEVVVGYNIYGPGIYVPFRWTQAMGMQAVAGFVRGKASISRDGVTVVGSRMDIEGRNEAWTWTEAGGLHVLPHLPGAFTSIASATNGDGSIVVGTSGSPLAAVMWRDGQVYDLGLVPGFPSAVYAAAVSDSGNVVVGDMGFGAAVWTPTRGMELLSDYLTFNGVQIPGGVTLTRCFALSADGTVFGGTAWVNGARIEGFVAVVPAPPAFLLTFVLARRPFRAMVI